MKNKGILSSALILSVGSVFAKIFSAVYRIGLTRILGGVGMGMYQLIFPFYLLYSYYYTHERKQRHCN